MFFTPEMAAGLAKIESLPFGWYDCPDGVYFVVKNQIVVHIKNDMFHNESGPAYIAHSVVSWYKRGLLHRLDGPAITMRTSDNTRFSSAYYIDDFGYTEQDYWQHPEVIKHKLNKILNENG